MKSTKPELARRKVLCKSNNLDSAKRDLARPRTMDQLNTSTSDVLDKAKSIIDALALNQNQDPIVADTIISHKLPLINMDRPLTSGTEDFQMTVVGTNGTHEMITFPAKVAEITYAPVEGLSDSAKLAEYPVSSATAQLLSSLGPSSRIDTCLSSVTAEREELPRDSSPDNDAITLSQTGSNPIAPQADTAFLIQAISQLCEKASYHYKEMAFERERREILEKKVEWMGKRLDVLEKAQQQSAQTTVGHAKNTSTPIKWEASPIMRPVTTSAALVEQQQMPAAAVAATDADDKLKGDMLQCLQMLRKTNYKGEDVLAGSDEAQRLADLNRAMQGLDNEQVRQESNLKQLEQVESQLR